MRGSLRHLSVSMASPVWVLLLALLAVAWMAPGSWARAPGPAGAAAVPAEVRLESLPPEARQTLALIRAGGPYPHARDGVIFGNREGLLPPQPRGGYAEFTVPTPGARDRGARRIVAAGRPGQWTDFWYTADHYQSFQRIRESP